PVSEVNERIRYTIANEKEYSGGLVATTATAAKYVSNVREFDRLSGLYEHGYPTQFRSNYHYWGVRFAMNRYAVELYGKGKNAKHLTKADRKDVWYDFRYACRWLYHQLKEFV